MGIADSMKNITEGIITSYDMRVEALGNLVADTRNTLKEFRLDRKKMSKEQASGLAAFMSGLTKSVDAMLKEFHKNHKGMSDEQAKNLARFMKDLTMSVGAMLGGFQEELKVMADELKDSLAKGETERLKAFKGMLRDSRKGIEDIETYVANKLKEFSDAHADMSEEIKKELAKYVAGIVSETKKLLGGFADERDEMAANWQALTATMDKRRGIKPEVEAEVKVRPVKEAIEEVSPEMKLEKKVLKFIEKHPKGIKVGDMEEPLGVASTSLGKIAKRLLEEGKVNKEENLYFPL